MQTLEEILGSRINIAVLRYLTAVRIPLSGNEIASRLGLQQSSVRKALERLVDARVLTRTDVGRSAAYQFNHDLAFERSVLVPLFKAETQLRNELIERLADVISSLKSRPNAVILFGSLARGARDFRDVDLLCIVSRKEEKEPLDEVLIDAFSSVQREFQVPINPIVATEAELHGKLASIAAVAQQEGLLLFGKSPAALRGVKSWHFT